MSPRKESGDNPVYATGPPEEWAQAVGLEPLEPYPGTKKAWRCRCTRCGAEVAPWPLDIRRGGGCRHCNWTGRAWNNAEEAAEVMRKALLEPLVSYPGSAKPWPCRCMTCGAQVAPRYSKVRHREIGCRFCVRRP